MKPWFVVKEKKIRYFFHNILLLYCVIILRCELAHCTNATQDPLAAGIDYQWAYRNGQHLNRYNFQPHERISIGQTITYVCQHGYYRLIISYFYNLTINYIKYHKPNLQIIFMQILF